MHLAREAGAVAHQAQVMSKSRHRGRQVGSVVVAPTGRDVLAGHKCIARRRAQWARTISRVESHALFRKTVDMRAFDDGILIATQRKRAELVGHHDEDILHIGNLLGNLPVESQSRAGFYHQIR